jgi:hypothetical protein
LGRMAWGCGLDSTGSGQGPEAGCCECGDEPSGSCATDLVSLVHIFIFFFSSVHRFPYAAVEVSCIYFVNSKVEIFAIC